MPQGIHGNSAERYIIAAKFPRDKISLSNDSPIYWQNLNLNDVVCVGCKGSKVWANGFIHDMWPRVFIGYLHTLMAIPI